MIYILIDEPQKHHYGSQVAAPIFAKIASYAVRNAGLSPVLINNLSLVKSSPFSLEQKQRKALEKLKSLNFSQRKNSMPNLIGLTLREAYQILKDKSVKIKVRGRGFVVKTKPKAGANLGKKAEIFLQ